MSREIKFRAWDKRNCEMRYSSRHDGEFHVNTKGVLYMYAIPKSEGYIGDTKYYKTYDVMQYTCLKDKNGVEIYEGDLIRVVNNENGALLVKFKNAYVGGWVLTHPSSNQYLSLGAREPKDIEVIGNIHQNPELLEQSND